MNNPCMYAKDEVERVCSKSKRALGSRWKWRKIADRMNLSFEQIETQLDIKIARNEEYINKLREMYDKKKNNLEVRTQREDSLPSGVSAGDPVTTIDGEEIRPRQTEDGSVTTGSIK